VLASVFDLRRGFFHMLFNRTVENFHAPFMFYRRFESSIPVMWRENCSGAPLTGDDFVALIGALAARRILAHIEAS